jgi:hypothetical protein
MATKYTSGLIEGKAEGADNSGVKTVDKSNPADAYQLTPADQNYYNTLGSGFLSNSQKNPVTTPPPYNGPLKPADTTAPQQ